jgi:glycosyltransferase involved in cell wall biosynthesis
MTDADQSGAPASAAQPNIRVAGAEGRPPVVLQVLPRLVGGGVERGAVDIAIALAEAGWGSLIASEGGPMVREILRHGAVHVELPLASKNPFTMRANVGRLARLITEHGVDIVHARSRAPAWSAEGAARRTGAHFVTTFHGTYSVGVGLKRHFNAVMGRGERVIAISDFIARHMVEVYRVDPARIRTIHRGVDIARFNAESVSNERIIDLATRWHLPDDRQIILLPGRFSQWKGHELVIEGLARLGRRDVLCIMVGADTASEGYLQKLTELAKNRNVTELVRFVDYCRDMPAAYMLSDVVLSAAIRPEAFGRTVAEGLAMGRPVVGPAHGGALEIVDDRRTGWLFNPGNAESMAAALHQALALDSLARAKLAVAGKRAVRARFTKERMCAGTLGVYAEVLGRAPATEPHPAPAGAA